MRPIAFLFSLIVSLHASADSILVVGDSLTCGHYGAELVKHLSAEGHKITMYCAVSSKASNWVDGKNPVRVITKKINGKLVKIKTTWDCNMRRSPSTAVIENCDGSKKVPKFEDILKRNPSDRVIVALGTNSLPGKADSTYSSMLASIEKAQRACTWIGPPHLQPQKAYDIAKTNKVAARKHLSDLEAKLDTFYDSLSTRLGANCDLIDSRDATKPGTAGNETGEGLHSTANAAAIRYQLTSADLRRSLNGQLTKSTTGRNRGAH